MESSRRGDLLVQGSPEEFSPVTPPPRLEEAATDQVEMERAVFWADDTAGAEALRWTGAR